MSLRTGSQIGTTTAPIINPNNLKIEGFFCQDEGHKKTILLYQDIRDVLPQGLAVNDADALTDPNDLVRLKDLIRLQFDLIGKHVVTAGREKVGKVSDYATETQTMFVQKLYVSQSLFKSFASGNLGVDRSQIVEITNDKIVIQDLEEKVPATAKAVA
jgi:sporulation protein YlmC with PRC-barrel domain